MVSILCFSTVSNVADVGGADGSDDDELAEVSQETTPDMEIGGETEDSQSSAGTSSRLTTPPPSTPLGRPPPGKRMRHGPKKDAVEDKLLEIIQKPESKPDEEELCGLSIAAKLRKIKDPKRKEYAMLQLHQTLFKYMYEDDPQPQPQPQQPQPQPQPQPQQLPQQFPSLMAHGQSSTSSGIQTYNYTVSGDGSTFTAL